MRRLFYFLIVCLSVKSVYAQDTIILEGRVLNDTINKASLNVVNLSLKVGTITDADGRFTIKARLNDTINISAVQYESRQLIVNQTIFNRKRISLYLIPKITELDEVNISNVNLSGNLSTDIENTKVNPVLSAKDLGIPINTAKPRTVEERRLYEAISSSGGVPINLILNAISGRLKMLRHHVEVSKFAKKVEDARLTFSNSIYMEELNIPEDLIEDFVYYIFEDDQANIFVGNNDALGLLEFMMEKSKPYLVLKEKEKQN